MKNQERKVKVFNYEQVMFIHKTLEAAAKNENEQFAARKIKSLLINERKKVTVGEKWWCVFNKQYVTIIEIGTFTTTNKDGKEIKYFIKGKTEAGVEVPVFSSALTIEPINREVKK